MDITVPRDTWAYWYDIINTEPREDYQFYSSLLDSNDTALEVACGTGRIYLRMLEDGYNVHGLDISEHMIQRLRNKASEMDLEIPRLYQQDISNLDSEQDYNLIYYPFNSIAHITGGVENQKQTMNAIYQHLTEDGVFAFDIFVVDPEIMAKYEEVKSVEFEHDGTQYKFETWSEIESLPEQTISSKNRIIDLSTTDIVWDADHVLSVYTKQQLELLLQQAGFSDISVYDEFTMEPLQDDSKQMSVIARK